MTNINWYQIPICRVVRGLVSGLVFTGLFTLAFLFMPEASQFSRHWVGKWPLALECAYADIPQMINYQGRLTDSSGTSVTGSVTLTFRLYDDATAGTKLWEESHTVSLNKSDNGLFSVILGSVTPLTSVNFNSSMWISAQVSGDIEMTPRQRLTATGYAMNASTLDGVDSASFLRSDIDTSASGKLTLTRSGTAFLVKPTTDPAADTKLIDVQNAAGTSKFSVDLEGDVSLAGTLSGATSITGTSNASWTVGNATDATASDVSLLLGQSTGQESLVFDGDSTDDFILSDDLRLNAQAALKFVEASANGTNFVAFQAPSSIASDLTWTLPSADGTANQVLTTSGSGALSWQTTTDISGTGDITGVTAGSGLTGGGASGDVTLTTGAGTGITVNADDVAINTAANLTYSGIWTLTGDWVNTTNPWADNEVSDTLTASIFKGTGSLTDAVDLATAEVSGNLTEANLADDSLDFEDFEDAMDLDATTTIDLGGFDLILDDMSSSDLLQLQNAQATADTATFYVADTATANAADLVISPSDGGILLDTTGAANLSASGSPLGLDNIGDARDSLAIATDPTSADSDGVIKLGRDGSNWEYLWYDNSARSGAGEFVLSAGLRIIGSSPATITFDDGTASKTLKYDRTAGTDGLGAFVFEDQAEIPASSPAYLTFKTTAGERYALKLNPDVSPATLSLVQINQVGNPPVETTLFEVAAGGRMGFEFINMVRNGSFEAFSAFEKFRDVGFAGMGAFQHTAAVPVEGGWDNFAPDEWVWMSGNVYQHSPLMLAGNSTMDLTKDAFHGKSAVAIQDPNAAAAYSLDVTSRLVINLTNDGAIKQQVMDLKPDTWYAVGVKVALQDANGVDANPGGTKALVEVDGEDVTAAGGGGFKPVGASAAGPLSTDNLAAGADKTKFNDLIGVFKTQANSSEVTLYLICQQTGTIAAPTTTTPPDVCRFDAVQVLRGKSVPEFSPNAIVDSGDQTVYGLLRVARTTDSGGGAGGGILAVDRFVRTRGIEFFGEDPGFTGKAGGIGMIGPPNPPVYNPGGTTGTLSLTTSGIYTGSMPRDYKVVITTDASGSGADTYTWSYRDIPMATNGTMPSFTTGGSGSVSLGTEVTLNDGVKIKFTGTNAYDGLLNDEWFVYATGVSMFESYNSFNPGMTYTAGESRIYKDPVTNKLMLQDGTTTVSLKDIVSNTMGTMSRVDPPAFFAAAGGGGTLMLSITQGYNGTTSTTFDIEICAEGTGTTADGFRVRNNVPDGAGAATDWDLACTPIPPPGGPYTMIDSNPSTTVFDGTLPNYGFTITVGSPSGTFQDGKVGDRWQLYAFPGSTAKPIKFLTGTQGISVTGVDDSRTLGLVSSCTSNQILKWNGANWLCAPDETGGASDAPASAPYVTIGNPLALTGERALAAGNGLTFSDGGANASVTLDVGGGIGIVVGADTVSVDVGTTANKIVQLDAGGALPVVSGANLINVTAANLVAGSSVVADAEVDDNLTIASSNVIGGPAGSAAAPTFSFTGDTNTGIFTAGADILSFATAGTEQMRIEGGRLRFQQAGTPGIPTISSITDTDTGLYFSTDSLFITAGGTNVAQFQLTTPGATQFLLGNLGGGASYPILSFAGDTNTGIFAPDYLSGGDKIGFSTGGTERFRIDNQGNVAIGTTSPRAKLDVRGDLLTPTGSYLSPYGGIGRYQNLLLQSEDLSTTWVDNSATAVTVTTNMSATADLAPNGTATADRLSQSASTTGAGRKQDASIGSAAANRTFTLSVWMKAATAHTARLQLKTATNTQTAVNASVTTSWQRFSSTYTVPTGDWSITLTAVIYLDDGATYNTLDVWGAQLEESSTPGVYVRTTTSAVAAGKGAVTDGVPTGTTSGTVTSVDSGAGLTGGPITGSGTLAVGAGTGIVVAADSVAVDVGTTANKIVQLNASAQLPAVDGSLLTALNASNLASGTVADARLSTNVPLLNAANTFTGTTASPVKIKPASAPVADTKLLDVQATGVGTTTFSVDYEGDVIANSLDLATPLPDAEVDNALTISGGTVNNSIIGATTAAAGTFTTLTANTSVSFPANSVTDAMIPDTLTAANYLPLAGGTMTGNLTFSDAQKLIGGAATTADLTLQTTSGVGAAGADMHFLVGNNGATEALTILNSGNVGIGTTGPTVPLHAVRSGTPASPDSSHVAVFQNSVSTDASIAVISTSGGFNSNIYLGDTASLTRGIIRMSNSTGSLGFGTNGIANRMVLNSSGNVGIGTATPAYTLDVAGRTAAFNSGQDGSLAAWSTNANALPAALSDHSSVVANGYVYVLGGYNASFVAQSTVYYAKLNSDGSTGAWSTNANALPEVRYYHSSIVANGYVYVLGGFDTAYRSTVYYAKLNADGSTGTWSTNANALPAGRYDHSSVGANGYVYVIGGVDTAAQATVYYAKLNADGSTGTWSTNANALPAARNRHSSVVANGYVYVLGGAGVSTVYYAKLNSDGSTGTWSTNANALPAVRLGHSSIVANGYVYVLGGANSSSVAQSTVYYAKLNANGSTGTWSTNANALPAVRGDPSSIVANGYVYVLGGWNGGVQSTVYYASTARMRFAGNLDLLGLTGQTLTDAAGDAGATITAGNILTTNTLEVGGNTQLWNGLGVVGPVSLKGDTSLVPASAAALSLGPFGTAAGNTGEARFLELAANGVNYTGLKAPDSLAGNVTYTLPTAAPAANGYVLSSTTGGVLSWAADASGSGTVTSVGLALPSLEFTVTSSPVTTSGTLTGAWASQAANLLFASPNGAAGAPSFRALVDADVPDALTISGGTVNNSVIGATTAAAGTFTALTANTSVSFPANSVTDAMIPDTLTAANYLPLAGGTMTGALAYSGAGLPKRTIVLTSAGAIVPAANAPQQLQTNGTNVSYYTLNYSGTAAGAESAHWQFIVPDSYTGTTVNATLYWLTPSVTTANVVKWFVDMNGLGDAQTLDAALNTAGTVTDNPTAVADQVLVTTEIASITTGWTAGEYAVVRVQRNAADVADTEAALAKLLMIKLEWTASAESD